MPKQAYQSKEAYRSQRRGANGADGPRGADGARGAKRSQKERKGAKRRNIYIYICHIYVKEEEHTQLSGAYREPYIHGTQQS